MTTIAELLAIGNVLVDLRASDKERVLAELSKHAARGAGLAADVVLAALRHRETLGSTGIGEGIALPHARLAEVKTPFAVLARLKSAIPFDAIDGRPVDLLVLLLLPSGAKGEHLNALACVARRLRDATVADTLRRGSSPAELYAALTSRPPDIVRA